MWERLAAESDTCTNKKCPHYKECFFFKARSAAEEAHILVANHHLLFADLSLRKETGNYDSVAIIPAYSRIVIDEAHHIEDIATDFFGDHISKMGILRLLSRITSEKNGKPHGKLSDIREKLEKSYKEHDVFEVASLFSRLTLDFPTHRRDLQQHITETFHLLSRCIELLSPTSAAGDDTFAKESKLRLLPTHYAEEMWQKRVIPSTNELIIKIRRFSQSLMALEKDLKCLENETFQEYSKSTRQELAAFTSRLSGQADLLERLIITAPPQAKVRWIEQRTNPTFTNVSLQDADLDISKALVEFLFSKFSTIVLCSATLTTNRDFSFFCKRLGLSQELLDGKPVIENIYDSPFSYKKQVLLAVPKDLPPPQHSDFLGKAAEAILQAINISRGATFVLFTSYSSMKMTAELLLPKLEARGFILFKQGDAERQKLLAQFKTTPRAVLFGTDSFWEGIDVAGEALRCVIIAKLPFRVPSEPITEARVEAILAKGGDPFVEYSLPSAIVKFKQGFGRLIRHGNDRGCIICLDTRLINKRYGRYFLESLPACEQCFVNGDELSDHMRNFYRKTQHMVRKA